MYTTFFPQGMMQCLMRIKKEKAKAYIRGKQTRKKNAIKTNPKLCDDQNHQ